MKRKILILIAILFIAFSNSICQVNLNQGLVAYYPFNGNANDASGNNINGVVNGASLTTNAKGVANSAYEFDGVNNYIQLPYNNKYNFAPSDSFSISCWIQPYSNPTFAIAQAIIVKSPFNVNSNASQWNYGLYSVYDKAMTGWAANNFLNASTLMKRDRCWYHLVVTYKNGIWKLFVNNKIEAQDLTQSNFIIQDGANSTIGFGRKGEANGDFYKGKLDEIRIYNRNLNSQEVDSLYLIDYDKACVENICNSWLKTPTSNSYVEVGDIDVIGNQMTIECNFNSNLPNTSSLNLSELVCKNTNGNNSNYALWPEGGYISTTNGNRQVAEKCSIQKNKTYHNALIYDGSFLMFYRNGVLHDKQPITGNLINNDFITTIANQPILKNLSFNGNINEVRIWKTARTEQEINQYMNDTLPNPVAQIGLLAYYTFNSLINKQGNPAFDGTIIGSATIGETNPQCSFVADSCGQRRTCDFDPDFSFSIDSCNPKSITFKNETDSTLNLKWDFDNNFTSGASIETINFSAFKNYNVKLIVTKLNGCVDSISKLVSIYNLDDKNLITLPSDTTICANSLLKIPVAQNIVTSCWTSSDGSPIPSVPNNTVSPTSDVTYTLQTQVLGNNLIVNGDFEQGNIGFNSDYTYQPPPNTNEGVYFIGTNPQSWNSNLSSCKDQTTTNGNMLMVNGNSILNQKIWQQTIPIKPNTNYIFKIYLTSLYFQNTAKLKFSINNTPIGNLLSASTSTCLWDQFSVVWNSGNNTSADISVVNLNTTQFGNDFAIDDISFSEIIPKTDSIHVKVKNCSPIPSFTLPDTVCVNQPFLINNTSTNASTYNWNFCNSNLITPLIGSNLGNFNSSFKAPVAIEYIVENNNHYAFVVNNNPSGVTRLDFGNSFLNTPTAVQLTSLNGLLWNNGKGALALKIIKQNNNWFGILAGGSINGGNPAPRFYKIEFGNSIANTTPTLTNWGRIGTIDQVHQIYTWEENNKLFGLVCNSESNTISRIDFTNSLSNIPTETNLGNLGNLDFPSHLEVVKNDTDFLVFITNTVGNTITKLNFGNSLLNNNPTSINLGNSSGNLNGPGAIRIYKLCNFSYGYVTNQNNNITLLLNFGTSVNFFPTADSIGNIGTQSKSSSFSNDFYILNDRYFFRTNSTNNTISLIKFPGCNNSSIPSSTFQNPPQISFNSPGIYDINLLVDQGLPTQESYCKQIEVINCDTPKCKGSIELHQFDGVTLPITQTNYHPPSGFTWETWFKLNTFDNNDNSTDVKHLLISAINPTACQDIALTFGWNVAVQKNELGFVVDGNGSCSSRDNNPCKARPSAGFRKNVWYHVAGVKDYTNNTTKLYLNGNLVDTKTNTSIAVPFGSSCQIGRYIFSGNTDSTIDGEMDEIRFWNFPRADSDILKTYNTCLNGNENGLISYYKCNERNGLVLKDYSTNKFNASLDYAVTWNPYDNAPIKTPCENPSTKNIDTTICKDSSYLGYTIAGIYTDTLVNAKGCDSIRILNLKIDSNCNKLNETCKGSFSLKGNDRVIPPQTNFKKFIPASGFTWECWFNGSYFANASSTIDSRCKLIACTDIIKAGADAVIGFGWPDAAQKRELCFVVDGPVGGTTDRDINPCKYFPNGGFIANKWYHVAGVKDYANNTTKLFVDGVLVDSKVNTSKPLQVNFPNFVIPTFYFGSMGLGSIDSSFPGRMDEIRLWNYPRTDAEILSNYNICINGKENGLLAYYHGNSLKDASPNGNDLTLGGGAIIDKSFDAPIALACYQSSKATVYKTICFGQSSNGFSTSGFYRIDSSSNSFGCDSITYLQLTVLPKTDTLNQIINSCKTVIVNGVSYNSSATAYSTPIKFKNTSCDSVVTKYIITITPLKSTFRDTICQGKSYWNKTVSGSYDSTFKLASGCDSIVTLQLFVTPSSTVITKDTLSGCGSYIFNNKPYFKDTLLSFPFKNIAGCDSALTQHQIIITKKKSGFTKSICLGQSFWGKNISGSYDSTFKLAGNCDSVVTLNLIVDTIIRDTHYVKICYDSTYRGFNTNNIFRDTIKVLGSCDTSKITFLTILPKPNVLLQPDASICENSFIELDAGNFKKYKWITNQQTQKIKVKNVGLYWVQVTDSFSCKASDSFNLISIYPNPSNFFIRNPYESCLGERFPLDGFTSYLWNTGDVTSSIILNGDKKYWVTVTDINNCVGKDTLNVTYTNKLVFDIPNAFSPNNDNINDEFKPFNGSNCLTNYNLQIFNRWGQKVFERNDPNKGWNGTMNGKQLPSDVYFYIINYKSLAGIANVKSGYITLLR